MTLEMYGSEAQAIDATWLPPTDAVYIVSARCADRCHSMRQIILMSELDSARSSDVIFAVVYERITRAFAKVHPVAA